MIALTTAFMKSKMALYKPLIKSPQTGLLLTTGVAGYLSARCPILNPLTLFALAGSLFFSISGSTILNMWHDRDIDAKMERTCLRPIPSERVSHREALFLGLILSTLGVGWAFLLNPLYGTVIFAGLFFDVIVYTIWLKRRTAWSIIWGGVSGGMPILAGRILGLGGFDWVGVLLALAILFWIPTHIMTFNLRYADDYSRAGVPTFPSRYGIRATRIVIAISSILAGASISLATYGIGLNWGFMRVLLVLSVGLVALAIGSTIQPSERLNFGLFKYASLFMLLAMIIMVVEVL